MLDSQQLRKMEQQEIQKQLASVPSPINLSPSQMIGMPPPPLPNPNSFPPPIEPPKSSLPSLLTLKIAPPSDLPTPNQTDQGEKGLDLLNIKLPAALEQALAFKSERAKEVGRSEFDSHDQINTETSCETNTSEDVSFDDILPEPEKVSDKIDSRSVNLKKKKKKKKKKHSSDQTDIEKSRKESLYEFNSKENVPEIEYVQEIPSVNDLEPMYRQFARVFEAFKLTEPEPRSLEDKGEPIDQYPPVLATPLIPNKIPPMDEFDEDGGGQQQQQGVGENGAPRLSKRKLKRLTRLSVAELKQLVGRPDVVEMHDVTARYLVFHFKVDFPTFIYKLYLHYNKLKNLKFKKF